MSLRHFLVFTTLLSIVQGSAQQAIGTWEDHLSYRVVTQLAADGDVLYCAAGQGMYSYNISSGEIDRYSKVNRLSDVGVSHIAVDELGRVIVGYTNGNLDIIEGEQTYNLSDIKRSSIIGDKGINDIQIEGNKAWLACGFGLVIIDLDALEVSETYFIGDQGGLLKTNSILLDQNQVTVSTQQGILRADRSDNLADFASWSGLNAGLDSQDEYFDLVQIGDKIYTHNKGDSSRVYRLTTDGWTVMEFVGNDQPQSLSTNGELLMVTNRNYIRVFDSADFVVQDIWSFPYAPWVYLNAGVVNAAGHYYVADADFGLVSIVGDQTDHFFPESPHSDVVWKATAFDGRFTLAHGALSGNFDNTFDKIGFSSKVNGSWYRSAGAPILDTIRDFVDVVEDRLNPDRIFLAAFFGGLMSYNGASENYGIFNEVAGNSPIEYGNLNPDRIHTSSLAYDINNNLWTTNSYTELAWKVRTPSGNWHSLGCLGGLSPQTLMGDMVITEAGQTWTILPRGNGLAVLQHNNNLSNTSSHECKQLGTDQGNGGLPTSSVLSIAQDLDGEIWVGTSEGPVVNYSPQSIFSNSPSDFQPILVDRDGNIERLLGSESITAIEVDGANRKWIGTLTGGVFLLSEDGTEELQHFTVENSPLLSNTLRDIEIDEITGTVYFVTDGGVLSYLSDATAGLLENTCYDVYPNPVRPGYQGPITIDGLKASSEVKITDLAGNIVFQMISSGGRATWQGQDFSGNRVSTGVYFALVSDPEGESTCISKILFVN